MTPVRIGLVLASLVIGKLAIPAAFAERGYWAVGGEWLLVIAPLVVLVYLEIRHSIISQECKEFKPRSSK